MTTYRLDEVFNEAAIPTVTFVPPKEFKELVGSLRTKGKHVTLCGPSGCGKSTLAQKAIVEAGIPKGEQHWLSGRDHASAKSWTQVFANALGCSDDESELLEWLCACGLIVIDDFHHLAKDVRDSIGKLLKRWHERGIRCLIIGIAETTHTLLTIDSELGIRNDPYEMKTQDDRFTERVLELGETALNIKIEPTVRIDYVTGARGIPSAIQAFARVACVQADVTKTCEVTTEVSTTMHQIRDSVLRMYKGKYHNKVIGLAKGKQQARSVHHTYFQIIKHICAIDKNEISVEELRKRIVESEEDKQERARKTTSFHNCLNNLSSVINDRDLSDAIFYDSTSKTISIEDPSFRLYLNLVDVSEIERAVHVRNGTYSWDVALSFAGEQRDMAERLRTLMNDQGYTVFYDFDQQAMLWGKNLRTKLADVYANEAEFLVVFLSQQYPEKDWPAFEFEVAKEAKKKRSQEYILPLLVDDVHVVGLSKDYGYIDMRKNKLEEVAKILSDKIEQSG